MCRNRLRSGYFVEIPDELKTPGDSIRIACDDHPWEIAQVFLAENRFAGVTDANGRFSLGRVLPGTYTIELWHETLGRSKTQASVKWGEVTELNLSMGSPQ